MELGIFVFNDFSENTYVLYDETRECVIIDPGCNSEREQKELISFIEEHKLTCVKLINTHCHIDHVLGNRFVSEKYGLKLECHHGEIPVLESCKTVASMYHLPYNPSPDIEIFLSEGDKIVFGNTKLDVIFTPGHSPASISLYDAKKHILISGDVLFKRSIGRTDLPGGSFETLKKTIQKKLYVLPNETVVYPGHGPKTTIGEEKALNQFIRTDH